MSTVQEELKKQLEYSNLIQWHDNGFNGEGINIWNTEGGTSEHGQMVTIRIKDAAPACNVYEAGLIMEYNNEMVKVAKCQYNGIEYQVEDFIKEFDIKVITRSVLGSIGSNRADSKFWNLLKDKYKLIFFNCAGNEGEGSDNTLSASLPSDVAYYVGACGIDKNGKPKRDNYSSIGKEIDFCNFRGFYSGTSFAAPYTAGQACLLKQRYGKEMSSEEIFKLLVMISKDMNGEGFDNYTGYGIPIFPDVSKKYITMIVGEKNYHVDGKQLQMDTSPINKEGNVFVPIRAISEGLSKKVDWSFNNDKTIKITIIDSKNIVVLNTKSDIIFKNGTKRYLNFAPYVDSNNRTLVPIRAIAEALDCKVEWIQKENKVMILEL